MQATVKPLIYITRTQTKIYKSTNKIAFQSKLYYSCKQDTDPLFYLRDLDLDLDTMTFMTLTKYSEAVPAYQK